MIDWTKPIQTKRGEPAMLVYTYSDHVTTNWPRVCVIGQGTKNERMCSYTHSWSHAIDKRTPEDNDIVNVPEKVVLGVFNVYDHGCSKHPSRHSADTWMDGNCTHVVTIKRIGDEVTATVEKVQ